MLGGAKKRFLQVASNFLTYCFGTPDFVKKVIEDGSVVEGNNIWEVLVSYVWGEVAEYGGVVRGTLHFMG